MQQEIDLNGLIHCLWAKADKKDNTYHPLLWHMIDTSCVADYFWRNILGPSARKRISAGLNLDEESAGRWIPFIAGLHDIGKASPVFQSKVEERRKCLNITNEIKGPKHGVYGEVVLIDILSINGNHRNSLNKSTADLFSQVLAGHHGQFPRSNDFNNAKDEIERIENNTAFRWSLIREHMIASLSNLWILQNISQPEIKSKTDANVIGMLLAGLISVSDWIASNKEFFPYKQILQNIDQYFNETRDLTKKAFKSLAWEKCIQFSEFKQISELFSTIAKYGPRPLQSESCKIAENLNDPTIMIIECPMGEGKTEAALYLQDCLNVSGINNGCYIALPTQATSNQMFSRVKEYISNRYSENVVNLMLLHSHANLSSEFKTMIKDANQITSFGTIYGEKSFDGAKSSVVAAEWFTQRKRGLLSPFGVGTVDQILLAVQQTRHVFVRLFGLSNKTIIIDEVHAYDTYMTTLLDNLIKWLSALGCSIILLSATLPRKRSEQLLKAYACGKEIEDNSLSSDSMQDYPRISWLSGNKIKYSHVLSSIPKNLQIKWVDGRIPENEHGEFAIGEKLSEILKDGGCAAIICNTVNRAQKIYHQLKKYFPNQDAGDGFPELDLFHARFLWKERNQREKRALIRFGKPESIVETEDNEKMKVLRPKRAILVATQVIEQSLDLDFDVMISDMAPVDLILQRAGRICRHDRGPRTSTLYICKPENETDGIPQFDKGTEAVYKDARYILLRSWISLEQGKDHEISIPGDVESLIENTYGEENINECILSSLKQEIDRCQTAYKCKNEDDSKEGESRVIKPPEYSGQLWRMTENSFEEDSPESHKAHRALTRLGPPSFQIIFVYQRANHLYLNSDCIKVIDIDDINSHDTIIALLKNSTSISHIVIVSHIIENPSDYSRPAWKNCAYLRHCRLIQLNEGIAQIGKYKISIDLEQGVMISKQ
jgi:CRISPR-associated endonuclease/helicase Cas3